MDDHPPVYPRSGSADELDRLLILVVEGGLTPDDQRRLGELLASDAEARRYYARYIALHAALETKFVRPPVVLPASFEPLLPILGSRNVESHPQGPSVAGRSPVLGFLASAGSRGWGYVADHGRWFSVVAVLAVLAALGAWMGTGSHRSGEMAGTAAPSAQTTHAGETPAPQPLPPAARLVRSSDCQWVDPAVTPAEGAVLSAGHKLELSSGVAQIVFQSGAEVNLHGPAIFQIESANSGFLTIGQLRARAATPTARGFTIRSRNASTVDMGTEFQVAASADGHSQIEVVSGSVEVELTGGRGRHRLAEGQALGIEPGVAGVMVRIEPGDGTAAFKFPTIEPPSDQDYADASQHHASIRVVEGKLMFDSGPVERLLDGRGQSKADSPSESVLFKNDEEGKFLVDLGKAVQVRKINTYSWHTYEAVDAKHDYYDARAPQRYTLYGYAGDAPPAVEGDPAARGWTPICRVNTDEFFAVPPVTNRPQQQGVSVTGAEGQVGRFRFLLWHVRPTHVNPPGPQRTEDQNTFYGEFDVYAE